MELELQLDKQLLCSPDLWLESKFHLLLLLLYTLYSIAIQSSIHLRFHLEGCYLQHYYCRIVGPLLCSYLELLLVTRDKKYCSAANICPAQPISSTKQMFVAMRRVFS
jgi:hypothetical protein